eukprot:2284212-Pleurochrysis_carterae.AAC.3
MAVRPTGRTEGARAGARASSEASVEAEASAAAAEAPAGNQRLARSRPSGTARKRCPASCTAR